MNKITFRILYTHTLMSEGRLVVVAGVDVGSEGARIPLKEEINVINGS